MKHRYALLIIWLLILLTSCASIDKAIKVATKNDANAEATQYALNQKHRLIVAENCASLFPVAESEVTRGEEKTTEREEETPGQVIPCEENGQPVTHVKCPPSKTIYRDTYRTDTIRVRDRAAEAALQERLKKANVLLSEADALLEKAKVEIIEKTESRNNYRAMFWGLLLLIGGFVAFKVFRR